jgi:hypothetical protein
VGREKNIQIFPRKTIGTQKLVVFFFFFLAFAAIIIIIIIIAITA